MHPQTDLINRRLNELDSAQPLQVSRDLQEHEVNGLVRIDTFVPVPELPGADWYVGLSVIVTLLTSSCTTSAVRR